MSQHRKHRGFATQRIDADYLKANGWPYAEPVGAGRPGSDVTGALLVERPICERCGMNPSDDVHEIVSRARGGSIVDRANLAALCRGCHVFITEHPAAAEREGFSAPSWERDRYTTDVEGRPE
jgi:hypothetical protein